MSRAIGFCDFPQKVAGGRPTARLQLHDPPPWNTRSGCTPRSPDLGWRAGRPARLLAWLAAPGYPWLPNYPWLPDPEVRLRGGRRGRRPPSGNTAARPAAARRGPQASSMKCRVWHRPVAHSFWADTIPDVLTGYGSRTEVEERRREAGTAGLEPPRRDRSPSPPVGCSEAAEGIGRALWLKGGRTALLLSYRRGQLLHNGAARHWLAPSMRSG